MARFFEVDFQRLIQILLPVRWRKEKQSAWLGALCNPILELYNAFMQNRNSNLYSSSHNSQVVFLNEMLNDTYDPIDRRIYISDSSNFDPLYVYRDAENRPLWLGLESEVGLTAFPDPQWLYTNSESSMSVYAFIVWVPFTISFDTLRMRAIIDQYRLPSKNYYTILNF